MKQLADKLRFIRSGGYYFRDPFAAVLTNNLLAVYETKTLIFMEEAGNQSGAPLK